MIMDKLWRKFIFILCFGWLLHNLAQALPPLRAQPTLFQVGTEESILQGNYTGSYFIGNLLRYGDFGLGTFNQLDGVLIILEGQAYQVKASGKINAALSTMQTPYAKILFFQPSQRFQIKQTITQENFQNLLEENLKDKNIPYAIRIDGDFKNMLLSSPYPHKSVDGANKVQLSKLAFGQGTLVGFWFPTALNSIGAQGMHFHFINQSRDQGGHAVSYTINRANISLQPIHQFMVNLP